MRKTLAIAFVLACSLCNTVNAQPSDPNSIRDQMVKDWQRAKEYTQSYMDAMPADKYGFKAVDSIRSFAEQLLHLAQGTIFLSSYGLDKKNPWMFNLETSPGAASKDSVMYYVNASYDFVIEGLQAIDPMKMSETVSMGAPGTPSATKYAWINKAFEHQTHHRGQATIYIRLVGIRPPGEKLF
ncbi:DinB family protein [Foetidibacter luteolus]|uniref:DinB family protein n=1 Tax=Foetidibacter luteolus TaxID=2608880 RepID=UPI00129A2993|nr:DinB family protein [Foetidibacter luteolus]